MSQIFYFVNLVKMSPRSVVEWGAEDKLLHLFELVHTEDSTRVTAVAANLFLENRHNLALLLCNKIFLTIFSF
jgi:hypothetical protein